MNPIQILAIVKGRRREALSIFVAMATAIFAAALALPVQYTATSSIVLNLKSTDALSAVALPGGLVSTHIATQVDVLQSERVLLKAVDQLGLQQQPEWQARWQAGTRGKKPFDVWAAEAIAKKLAVKPAADSSVLTVSYTADQPELAARTVNAVVRAYVDTSLEMRLEPARLYSRYFDERAAVLRASLERSRAKLLAYQRSNNLVITDDKVTLEAERLHELNAKLTEATVSAAESATQRRRATALPGNMREALADPVTAALSEELSRQQAYFTEQAERLGPRHPQVIELASRIAGLEQRRDAAIRKTLGSLEMADTVKQTQLRTLEQAVSRQRSQVLDLEARRVEAGLIEREIESAQRAYDAVLEKASQASLQSGDNQSDISVLSTASTPLDRRLVRWVKLGGIAAGGAALAALLFVLIREQFDRKLRTEQDITTALGQHLLVQLPPMRDGAARGHALFSLPGKTGPQRA